MLFVDCPKNEGMNTNTYIHFVTKLRQSSTTFTLHGKTWLAHSPYLTKTNDQNPNLFYFSPSKFQTQHTLSISLSLSSLRSLFNSVSHQTHIS